MYGSDGPDTFWLNFTNIALGLVTLLCVLVVVGGVVREISYRFSRRKKLADDHAFVTPELGLTMADGGEKLPEKDPEKRQ